MLFASAAATTNQLLIRTETNLAFGSVTHSQAGHKVSLLPTTRKEGIHSVTGGRLSSIERSAIVIQVMKRPRPLYHFVVAR